MENRKVLKSPVVKRRSRAVPVNQRVSLERVIGITASSNVALSCDPYSSTVAYPAGCVVVLCNPRKKQSHIYNFAKKTIQTLAFSPDGKHVVTGESGHQPAVRVWDVEEKTQVAEFHGHKFGINCVAFSPNNKHIVSIGTQHDMMVNVWNWKTGTKVASNKISSKVSAVAFSDDGSMFVTVGNRHVKFWYLDSSKSKINETVPLLGRSGILGDQKNNHFCDVVCGKGFKSKSVFIITQSGILCEFNEKRLLEKWVELRTSSANCIAAGEKHIFIGCANGVVRVFNAQSLQYVSSLPHPHCLGVDVSSALNSSQMVPHTEDAKFADTIALVYDEYNQKVTCIYNDHSVYIWDVHDLKKVGKAWSYLYHSSCIYGLEIYPVLPDVTSGILPPGTFVTCSLDDTIRIWNLDSHMKETPSYKRNVYSNELLKIAYVDPLLTYIRDVDYNPAGGTDKTDTNYDGKNGIRSLKVSPDGQHLASGDRIGTVRIHDLQKMKILHSIEAHDGEVLCVEYSHLKSGPKLLATASRDRFIHVFDVEQNYGLLQTLDDHSSSITAVRFTETDQQLKMLSCGADKSLLFRNAQSSPEFQFTLSQHLVGKTTLYDMVVDPTQKFVATACQDRNIRIYNIKTAKQKKHYKGSLGDDGTLLKIQLDPSGTYAVTSCTDKNICIIDFCTGELVATMYGHSEIITGVKFCNDLKHLISVSGDGCLFVWRLPGEMTKQMRSRLADIGQLPPELLSSSRSKFNASTLEELTESVSKETEFKTPSKILAQLNSWEKEANEKIQEDAKPNLDYRFSVGQLPKWAKSKLGNGEVKSPDEKQPVQPRGKWASRADSNPGILSQLDGKTIELPDPNTDRKKPNFAEDTHTQDDDLRRETLVLPKPKNTPAKIPVIQTSDEDDDDDDDDDFFPQFHKKEDQSPWDDLQNFKSRKSDQTDSGRLSWLKRQSFNHSTSVDDLEELDNDSPSEVIYYPPSDSESIDTAASNYTVFANGSDTLKRMKNRSGKNLDADSESTDAISIEDIDDDDDSSNSYPTTPSDDFRTPDREKFLKDTFENLQFTPMEKEQFLDQLDKDGQPPPSVFNSRLSISSRFLSRAQQANIRNIAVYNSIQRQDNWFDSVQRRKDEMARAVDETRKRLLAMGWNDQTESEQGDNMADISPVNPNKPADIPVEEQRTPTNLRDSFPDYLPPDIPPSPSNHKSLRRCWSTFDLPKQPILEERSSLRHCKSNPSTPISKVNVSVWETHSEESDDSYMNKTPTNCYSRSRPDSLSLNNENKRSSTPRSRSSSSLHRQTESSKAKMSGTSSKSTTNLHKTEDRRDSGSKKMSNLTKSSSLQNLNNPSVSVPKAPKRKGKSPKTSSMYTSVPNLLAAEDTTTSEDSSVEMSSNLKLCSSLSLSSSVPDLLDGDDKKVKKPEKKISTGRLSAGSNILKKQKSDEGKKTWRMSLPSSVGSSELKSNKKTDLKDDRELMPPPATTVILTKSKQDTFLKRAVQTKRRTTSELTLDQAKNILLGKSGILNGDQTSKTENSPTSPTTTFTISSTSSKSVSDSTKQLPSKNSDTNIVYTHTGPVTSTVSMISNSQTKSEITPQRDNTRIHEVAAEIDSVAAEIKRKNVIDSAFNRLSELDASPNDLPERDTNTSQVKSSNTGSIGQNYLYNKDVVSTKPEPTTRKEIKRSNSRGKDVQKKPNIAPKGTVNPRKTNDSSSKDNVNQSKTVSSVQPKAKPRTGKSPIKTEVRKVKPDFDSEIEEELASSLSVKERIANLNAQVSSPRSESPRLTSSAHITLSSISTPTKVSVTNTETLSPHSSSGVGSSLDSEMAAKVFASPGSSPQSTTENPSTFDVDDIYGKTSPGGHQKGFVSLRNTQGFSPVRGTLDFSPSKDSLQEILNLSSNFSPTTLGLEEEYDNRNMSVADALAAVSSDSASVSHSVSENRQQKTNSSHQSELSHGVTAHSDDHRQSLPHTTGNSDWTTANNDTPTDNLQLCMEALREFRQDFKKVLQLYDQVSNMKDEKSIETTRLLEDALKEKKDTLTELLSKNSNTEPSSGKPLGTAKQADRDQSTHKSTLDDLEPLFDKMTDTLIKRIDDKYLKKWISCLMKNLKILFDVIENAIYIFCTAICHKVLNFDQMFSVVFINNNNNYYYYYLNLFIYLFIFF
ncbi:hypothetical protein KUTeg_013505 [Tegillarca granosa]|uniref:Mitogen-activated protein kinase-binding protein 1 n=1 Tax=Tegillarca granosa TaxID=220873 RepID=A0ABQ9ETV9_TEGGR|nr:hypothetical protein KUTeg_013505 [Tegillarca granosa]